MPGVQSLLQPSRNVAVLPRVFGIDLRSMGPEACRRYTGHSGEPRAPDRPVFMDRTRVFFSSTLPSRVDPINHCLPLLHAVWAAHILPELASHLVSRDDGHQPSFSDEVLPLGHLRHIHGVVLLQLGI